MEHFKIFTLINCSVCSQTPVKNLFSWPEKRCLRDFDCTSGLKLYLMHKSLVVDLHYEHSDKETFPNTQIITELLIYEPSDLRLRTSDLLTLRQNFLLCTTTENQIK